MEVVLTGRLVLLDAGATAPAEAAPNNMAEEDKKLAASHEDTTPPGLADDPKAAATPSEQPKDAAAGAQEEAAAEAAMVVDESGNKKGGAKYRWEGKWYFRGNKNKSSTFAYKVSELGKLEHVWLQSKGRRGGPDKQACLLLSAACPSHHFFFLTRGPEGLASMPAISF